MKKLVLFGLIVGFVLLVSAWPFSIKGNTSYTYDDFDDSSINQNKWRNSSNSGTISDIMTNVTEYNNILEVWTYVDFNDNGAADAYAYATNFTNRGVIKNITSHVNLAYLPNGAGNSGAEANFTIWGVPILRYNWDAGDTAQHTDDSVWTIVRNDSANDGWIAYNDGVFNKSFTGTSNEMGFATKCRNVGAVICETKVYSYYVNFSTISSSVNVSLGLPSNGTSTINNTLNVTLATTPSDFNANLTNATLSVWRKNGTIFNESKIDLTGTSNQTSWIVDLDVGSYIWNVFSCLNDSGSLSCNYGTLNNSFDYGYIFHSNTSVTPVLESTSNDFTLNVSLISGLASSDAYIVYNNTRYLATESSSGSNYLYNRSLIAPNVAAPTGIDWRWELELNDGSGTILFNISNGQQTVNQFSIDDCSVNSEVILNLTLKDEASVTTLNASATNTSIQVDLGLYDFSGNLAQNFSGDFDDINPAAICGTAGITNSGLIVDAQIRYTSDNRVVEFYNIQNSTLSSDTYPQNISLYDLLSVDSQEFLVTFKDENFLPTSGALINVKRKYVGEGIFRSVEIPETNDDGQTLVHLVLGDVLYSIEVSKNGRVLGSFDNILPFCDDISTGDCRINLNAFSSGTEPEDFETKGNLTYRYVFNADARTVTTIFSTTDGTSASVNFTGVVFDNRGNQTVCSSVLDSSAGSIVCTIGISVGNTTIRGDLYKNGEFIDTSFFNLQESVNTGFGYTGTIMMILLFLTIPLMFITSPVGMIIGGVIGLVIAGLLNLYTGGSFIGITSTLIWIVIAGAILVWKINQVRQL